MSLPQLSSCEAEASIQKAIQDIKLGIKLLICKAFGIYLLPHFTIAYCLAGCFP